MAENKDKDIVMKCRHMEKVYPGTKALDDVDFNIYRGKVNVLIGSPACWRASSTTTRVLSPRTTPPR